MTDIFRPLKNAFGRFATGIAIAACRNDAGDYTAITINSFTSVSLDPALVLWCIERRASSFPAFMAAQHYSVSVLNASQEAYSNRFARFDAEPLMASEIDIAPSGAPLIKGRLAGFDCAVSARHQAGDHIILVGEVKDFDSVDGQPLLYFASRYHQGAGS